MMTKSFMQNFCGDNFLRPVENVIFPIEGYRVATDGRHCIVVPEEECEFELDYDKKKHGKALNVLAVCDPSKFAPTHKVYLSELKEYITQHSTEDEIEDVEVPTEFKECECCEDGKILLYDSVDWKGKRYNVEDEVDCPVCHGYGKIPTDTEYDPIKCDDDDDVRNWVSYEHRPTGRKIIGPNTITHISGLAFRAAYLYHVVEIIEFFHSDHADFYTGSNNVFFKIENTIYLVAGVYKEGCIDDGYPFIEKDVPCVRIESK